jgi:Tfp pilus assembly protein PilO
MSKTTRDNLIMVSILAAMVIGTAIFSFLPQSRELDSLKAQAAKLRVEMVETSQRAAVVPQMVRQVEELKSLYKNFGRRLPARKELGGFLREISTNLSSNQFSQQVIEPGQPAREKLFHTLPIILRFKGSYPALAGFLTGLGDMERLTQVQKLSISNNTGKDDEGKDLDIEVRMNIYFTES